MHLGWWGDVFVDDWGVLYYFWRGRLDVFLDDDKDAEDEAVGTGCFGNDVGFEAGEPGGEGVFFVEGDDVEIASGWGDGFGDDAVALLCAEVVEEFIKLHSSDKDVEGLEGDYGDGVGCAVLNVLFKVSVGAVDSYTTVNVDNRREECRPVRDGSKVEAGNEGSGGFKVGIEGHVNGASPFELVEGSISSWRIGGCRCTSMVWQVVWTSRN